MNFSLKKNSPENMAQTARAQLKNHHYKQKLEYYWILKILFANIWGRKHCSLSNCVK